MRAEVKRSFRDLKEKRDRAAGEVFELTEDRFAEINRKLSGYIVETDKDPAAGAGENAAAKPRAKRRAAANKAKAAADK